MARLAARAVVSRRLALAVGGALAGGLVLAGCPGGGQRANSGTGAQAPGPDGSAAAPVARPDPSSGTPTAAIARTQLKATMTAVRLAAEKYRAAEGKPAPSLDALVKNDYLKQKDSLDPWGRPYLLEASARAVKVTTYGADGQPGGAGADADYSSDDAQ